MNPNIYFKTWCKQHHLTRAQTAEIFGIDSRTVRRYLSGTTIPHGGVQRLIDVFKRHPEIETDMIKRHADITYEP